MAESTKTTSRARTTKSSRTSENGKPTAQGSNGKSAARPSAKDEATSVTLASESAVTTTTRSGILPLGSSGLLGAAGESDITNELEKGGPAFGSFVGAVGTSIADAQAKLDKTFIETAQALSNETVKVVSVFEQVIDDDGNLTEGKIHESELPLVNFITPTAYKWSRVYLTADMQVSEFSAESGMNIQSRSTSFNVGARAGYGLFSGFNAGGSTNFATSSFGQELTASAQTDSAAGQLHMEATLEPRDDIRPPQPYILQKGPTLKLLIEKIEDIAGPVPSGGGPTPVVGRKATIRAELRTQNGGPNTDKSIDTVLSESGLAVTSTGATDAKGDTTLTIERRNPANDGTPGAPIAFMVRAQFGLISDSLGLSL
jgi:hypothetical protein